MGYAMPNSGSEMYGDTGMSIEDFFANQANPMLLNTGVGYSGNQNLANFLSPPPPPTEDSSILSSIPSGGLNLQPAGQNFSGQNFSFPGQGQQDLSSYYGTGGVYSQSPSVIAGQTGSFQNNTGLANNPVTWQTQQVNPYDYAGNHYAATGQQWSDTTKNWIPIPGNPGVFMTPTGATAANPGVQYDINAFHTALKNGQGRDFLAYMNQHKLPVFSANPQVEADTFRYFNITPNTSSGVNSVPSDFPSQVNTPPSSSGGNSQPQGFSPADLQNKNMTPVLTPQGWKWNFGDLDNSQDTPDEWGLNYAGQNPTNLGELFNIFETLGNTPYGAKYNLPQNIRSFFSTDNGRVVNPWSKDDADLFDLLNNTVGKKTYQKYNTDLDQFFAENYNSSLPGNLRDMPNGPALNDPAMLSAYFRALDDLRSQFGYQTRNEILQGARNQTPLSQSAFAGTPYSGFTPANAPMQGMKWQWEDPDGPGPYPARYVQTPTMQGLTQANAQQFVDQWNANKVNRNSLAFPSNAFTYDSENKQYGLNMEKGSPWYVAPPTPPPSQTSPPNSFASALAALGLGTQSLGSGNQQIDPGYGQQQQSSFPTLFGGGNGTSGLNNTQSQPKPPATGFGNITTGRLPSFGTFSYYGANNGNR